MIAVRITAEVIILIELDDFRHNTLLHIIILKEIRIKTSPQKELNMTTTTLFFLQLSEVACILVCQSLSDKYIQNL